MGPEIFWARTGRGPWVSYDRDLEDENRRCLVRDRPWPYSWGDVIWSLWLLDFHPIFVRFEIDYTAEVILLTPGDVSSRPEEALARLLAQAELEVPKKALEVLPDEFALPADVGA